MISVFISYSHKDEALRAELETHLRMMQRQGLIDVWHDRRIVPGTEIDRSISSSLEAAQVVLLLVSPDFLSSDYCYDREMQRAMERHDAGKARVLPVILRPSDWKGAPFGKLLATPTDGKPVTKWTDADEAFLVVTNDIRRAIADLGVNESSSRPTPAPRPAPPPGTQVPIERPRSSNLQIKKVFTEADRDRFLDDAFEFMANFFEASLEELRKRNADIDAAFKRIDALKFNAVVYRNGLAVARCQIRNGGSKSSMSGITYSTSESDNSYNESLSVEAGDQMLHLKALGMQRRQGGDDPEKLSFEGAAEYYWALFIQRLQQ